MRRSAGSMPTRRPTTGAGRAGCRCASSTDPTTRVRRGGGPPPAARVNARWHRRVRAVPAAAQGRASDGRWSRMRTFLIFVVAVLGSAALPAQARQVTLELEGGTIVEGRAVTFDTKTIVVEVDGQQRTYSTEQIRNCKFKEIESEPPRATAAATAPTAAPVSKQGPPPANGAPAQQPDGAAAGDGAQQPAAAATSKPLHRSQWDKRLEA